ncbi:hypothetical protein D9757_001045 [Collybiopsis confluens]|uniref:Xylanolytic transcriptional activator regulatory domain-containing protein n=1 Tax=Collybiopsis confluens TaxID=2823264 RepID=A0A8H5MG90_9AGAR|nr:hypothetical protein D9757_001045 [Collybiopsis confluens]
MLIDLASYARSLSKKIDQTSSLDSGFGIDPRIQADTHLSDDTNVVLEPVNNTAEPLVSRIRGLELDSSAVAKPNQVTLLQTALDIRDEMEGGITTSIVLRKRPEYWAPYPWDEIKQSDPPFIFPEDSLLRELISLYFSRLHYINPLFHQPLFERQVFEEKLHLQNRIFGATLLAVCANAARCFSDSRTFYLNSQSEHSAGWKYFNQVRFYRSTFLQPTTLFEVQLHAMAMMFLSPVSSEMDAWPWDMAVPCIQLAQSNVLSIQMRSKGSLPSYDDMAECELWKRAFWVVTCFELIHAATINKRKILTPDQLEIEFPRECDDENWFNASDLKLHFVQPAGKPSYMAYWNYILKYLVRFSSLFFKLEEHISDSEGVQVLEDLSRKRIELLNDWFASMPAHREILLPSTVYPLESTPN